MTTLAFMFLTYKSYERKSKQKKLNMIWDEMYLRNHYISMFKCYPSIKEDSIYSNLSLTIQMRF